MSYEMFCSRILKVARKNCMAVRFFIDDDGKFVASFKDGMKIWGKPTSDVVDVHLPNRSKREVFRAPIAQFSWCEVFVMQEIVSLFVLLVASIVGFFALIKKGIEERETYYNENVQIFR